MLGAEGESMAYAVPLDELVQSTYMQAQRAYEHPIVGDAVKRGVEYLREKGTQAMHATRRLAAKAGAHRVLDAAIPFAAMLGVYILRTGHLVKGDDNHTCLRVPVPKHGYVDAGIRNRKPYVHWLPDGEFSYSS
jgi:hypothetical protein